MALIRLDSVLVDYISLTSYSAIWFNYVMESLANENDQRVDITAGSYKGVMVPMVSGTLSFLAGRVKGKTHYMIRISGQMAHHAIATLLDVSKGFVVSCSRLDVQLTIMKPVVMSMTALRNRLEKRYKRVGYPQPDTSTGVKLETVYVGTRKKSDRFYRFYTKATNDGLALRLEVELKKRRSRAIWDEWVKFGPDGSLLNYEIERIKSMDKYLDRLINLSDRPKKIVRVRTLESNTERWLINDVFPVLKRVLCSHSADSGSVISALYDVLEAYEESLSDETEND